MLKTFKPDVTSFTPFPAECSVAPRPDVGSRAKLFIAWDHEEIGYDKKAGLHVNATRLSQ